MPAPESDEGLEFYAHQTAAILNIRAQRAPERLCLYFKTGSGKTITGLACLAEKGYDHALVLCPPSTNDTWVEWGHKLGVEVTPMSHAKFRMKDTRVSRRVPVIVDEFHLLGGHNGKGWKKMDTMARHLMAPLIIMSATPNYNDAERVYCIQHVLDPHSCKGGYLEFLYRECITEQNPFSQTPDVLGFQRFGNAADYLAALPYVEYLPDDLVYTIIDLPVSKAMPYEMKEFGLNRRKGRIIASQIEEKHAIVDWALIRAGDMLRVAPMDYVLDAMTGSETPVIVFANHSTVAEALNNSFSHGSLAQYKVALVTGKTPEKKKLARIQAFRDGVLDVLIGTASLATGTDGLDKVCDTLIILDDTEDDSLRRQLIGRIMPRGSSKNLADKRVYRLVLQ